MRNSTLFEIACLLVLPTFSLSSCTEESSDVLAPYQASRPLIFLKVTQSFRPQIQWVGGRVAAVGVNLGREAALDSSLVWLMTADDNTIASFVQVGQSTDIARIQEFGGTPVDSLSNDMEYTFWLAEKEAFDAGLARTELDEFNFADTTMTMRLLLRGQTGGDRNLAVRIRIIRDETLMADKFIVDWTPSDVPFRRLAIREGTFGAFTNLIWHIVTPDSLADNILPPVTIGQPPSGTDEVIAWPESGFKPNTVHFLWMVNSNWTVNNFTPTATGYVWFRIFAF